MKSLVIYDSTGKVYLNLYGVEMVPQGLQPILIDIVEGAQLERIDITDSNEPKAIYSYLPESDVEKLQKEVKGQKEQITNLIAQIEYLSMMSGIETEVADE